jgi:hypothetical protein
MKRGIVALLVVLTFACQGTIGVLAGTTGSISGVVVDASNNQPVAGAYVTASSPSQTTSTTTDAAGHYAFLSLAPDTYTLTVTGTTSRDTASVSGVTVQADAALTVTIQQARKLQQIGSTTARSNSQLVRPGTTADVYSINATQQDKASTMGGGGTLTSAWSAISTVPGVFVAPNQNGYIGAGDGVSIRGGDYDQIGYELDGIPINRSFDNYPSGQLSALGQQEVQVYTGAEPATGEAEGLSGYINQVIKTGTYPATKNFDIAIGSPTYYGRLAFEAGGANPARTFSYYMGFGAYNQDYRYGDQFQGAQYSQLYGEALAPCPGPVVPSCIGPGGADYTNGGTTPAYVLGPYNYGSEIEAKERDNVVNLHFGIPKSDGTKDDVQVLFDNSHLQNIIENSINDTGGIAYNNAIGLGTGYVDSYVFNGAPVGSLLPTTYTGGGVVPYLFPNSPTGRALGAEIDPNMDDAFVNDQSVFKVQYQHNFGTNAFLRVYGYTYYSDWIENGPVSADADYIGESADYELSSHTRGASLQFSDQLNSQNLLTIEGSYTTAHSLRDNNFNYINGFFYGLSEDTLFGISPGYTTFPAIGVLVNSANPYNGVCYSQAHTAVNCYMVNSSGGVGLNPGAGYITLYQANTGGVPSAAGATCGTGACQYLVIGNGNNAEYNQVIPQFMSASITDDFRPTDKLDINFGLRMDSYGFDGGNTFGSNARTFFFNAWNAQFPTTPLYNPTYQTETFTELEPRVGATFTLDPNTVLRASYGRYSQAPNTAFEEYNFLESESPIGFPAGLNQFAAFGVGNTPMHAIYPEVSNNYDFSFEHQFGRDTSVKLTPFLRKTSDQIEEFYLNQKTSFVSGLNVGAQTSEGVELEVDKGDFTRNGFAGKLSFTYTNSYINFIPASNGVSVITGINAAISGYNAFTKKGGGSPCYASAAVGGATPITPGEGIPCTDAAAVPVANPYYNAPYEPLLSLGTDYPTFSLFPAGVGSQSTTYGAPYVATFLLQYKHGPLAITPALQFSAGQRYGAPITTNGVDPSTCIGGPPLASPITGDPRYGYGAPGGSPYDVTNCGGTIAIPDPLTKNFDGLGAFVAPNEAQLHLQIAYDISPKITLVASLTNIVNTCWGGTAVPFAVNHACGYFALTGGVAPIGNLYNPGDTIQPYVSSPYVPGFAGFPFNAYFEARIKL